MSTIELSSFHKEQNFSFPFNERYTVGEYLQKISEEAHNTTEKGQALELIFQEIAKSDPALDIEEIDHYTDWARKRQDHNFSSQDRGIDLVAKLKSGEYVGIQCKFYESKRSIQKLDVNSFLAKLATKGIDGSPFFSKGWIVSTTPLSQSLEEELASHICRVSHIPMREYYDEPLKTGFQFEKKDPRPYQEEAIERIQKALQNAKRGKLVMACGTGKTFTALRAMEKIVPRNGRVLFCAPTIALVSQVREEWLRQTHFRIEARVICSDPGAGKTSKKENRFLSQELRCPVTTKSKDIAAFLKEDTKSGIKVIFTTYQSLIRIKEAQQDSEVPDFDLVIADEAHRTTGSSKKDTPEKTKGFRMIHDDNDIRAEMRLYMTATPRVYRNSQALETRGYDITDMDDIDIYGNTLYEYTFEQAVKEEYLCDYRLIMLSVHETALTEGLKRMVRENKKEKISYDEMTRVFGTTLAVRGNSRGTSLVGKNNSRTGILHRTIAFANTVDRSEWYRDMINNPTVKTAVTRRERAIGGG